MPFFGLASGLGDVTQRDGMLLIDSGVNYGVFNIAMFAGPVSDLDTLRRRLVTASSYYERRNTRWSLWLCDDLIAPVRTRSASYLAEQGLRRLTEAPGMLAERLSPPDRHLPIVECRPVNDEKTRQDFAYATSVNFDIPIATCRQVYGNQDAWRHDYRGFVGYWKGVPVTTTAAVIAAGAIGIYSVGTVPPHRRKGYAESLMRQVIAHYTRTLGIERTVLQATRAGYDMYRKMGYRDVGHFSVFMT